MVQVLEHPEMQANVVFEDQSCGKRGGLLKTQSWENVGG
jgi:hypothetical protein